MSENLTCSNTSTRKISKDDTKDNGCDGKPPFLCKFQISIFGNFSIYEKFPGSYSYVSIGFGDSEDNGCDVEPLIHGEFYSPILGNLSIYEKFPRSYYHAFIGCVTNKLGNRFQNNQGLTKNIQYMLTSRKKQKGNPRSEFTSFVSEHFLGDP